MSVVEVCFVRHAQSVSNASGVWQGQGDSPLSELGRAQVEALGNALGGDGFDLAITSDLQRAADTSNALGAPVEADPAWREIDVGAWEGLTMEQVAKRFPEQIEALRARKALAIGGGETWPEVFRRADDALGRLRSRLGGSGRAIVFTHGGIIGSILAGMVGARERFPWPLGRMRNTGRTTIRFIDDRVELVAHNDDSHLPDDLRQPYEPRDDQTLVRITSHPSSSAAEVTAMTDFNSAIKSARKAGAGGVVSVSVAPSAIAQLAQEAAGTSSREFRFVEPLSGHTSELLISDAHRMWIDYARPSFQI